MNKFLDIQQIARTTLMRLMENLLFPNLCYKDFSNDFVAGKGAKLQVRKPVILEAKDFTTEQGIQTQDINDNDTVEVVLDKFADVSVELTAIQSATDVDSINRIFIEPAAAALASKINSDGLALYADIPYACGTAGTTPSSLEDIANARKILNEQKVPVSPRNAVWDTAADAKFTTIPAIVNAEKSGSTEALRQGSIGHIFGFDNYMSQAVKTHTSAITAKSAVKVNGAVTAGATSLSIDGTTLTGKLIKGDILTIGGKNYVVTADSAEAASNAIANVKVYPALPAIKDNADVTITDSHTANLVFNPFAFAFVTRPLTSPSGVESYVTSYNGISLRVTKGYDMKYKKDVLSMDVLYGYKTVYPELAARVMG